MTTLIPEDYRGQRIDVVVAALFPEYSRTQLTTALKTGVLLVNDVIVKPREKVQGNEMLSWTAAIQGRHAEKPLVAEDIPLHIIYEDEALLIINKPAGLVVHPGAGNPSQTLVNALLHHDATLATLPRAGILHRLDKDTTGLLLVAKTLIAYTHLFRQLQARTIKRHYFALLQGRLSVPGTLTTCFGRDTRHRIKMAVRREGKEAITHYTPKLLFPHFTLVDVELFTGRTHQIRVHMNHLKHAVVGDPLYGTHPRLSKSPRPELIDALKQFKRQALHAKSLAFIHPMTEASLCFEAPLPEDLEQLLRTLETHDVSS